MNVAASGRTWEDASSPAALRLTREYEEAWQQARSGGSRLEPGKFLAALEGEGEFSGARLAVLRADLALRWEAGERIGARWYVDRFPDLGEDTLVALIYEEFCLREDRGERPEADEFLTRYPAFSEPLKRVLEIHQLIGSATTSHSMLLAGSSGPRSTSSGVIGPEGRDPFPEAGETIGGFFLVEELGRGAFGRVFLARERELADRPVALKVTRKSSREPQALARLQHTHIVPVHSHRVDKSTGLHLLCMPYFGRITLSRVLAEVENDQDERTGATLVDALQRLAGAKEQAAPPLRSTCLAELARRSYAQAIAWWGARLAEALEHAHDRGILHRDIKPSNVLVIEDGMPMLLDFNLARESVKNDEIAGEATLGGTVDYMAPEHLEALAEGYSDQVDHRSDLYGLGVLLFEAVAGRKPFRAPSKGRSVIDALLRLAEERRRDPAGLFDASEGMPASLQAVVRRCLAPAPEDRYQSAGELATDLRAVADDLPLVHASEPILSRVGRGIRRNRRRLATTSLVFLALAALLGAYLNIQFERHDRYSKLESLCLQGDAEIDRSEFNSAGILFDNALQGVAQLQQTSVQTLFNWATVRTFPSRLRKKLELLWAEPDLDDLHGKILLKANVARLIGTTRQQADELLARSDDLRFRLIGLGDDLRGAVAELKSRLGPFYVLNSERSWNELEHIWGVLDDKRAGKLRHEVNELLFLWMVAVESSFRNASAMTPAATELHDSSLVDAALEVCNRALTFANPQEPWIALRTLLERQRDAARKAASAPGVRPVDPALENRLTGEPEHVSTVGSATSCFQWGLLNSSHGRRERAIRWLQRAVWLEWSNYWYQFYLAYLEDQAGLTDDALDHYCAAVARMPGSPWVRFSRGRLYRIKGRWDWALDDMNEARRLMRDAPEALGVRLEIGVLHQSLGNFGKAKEEYRSIIDLAPHSQYARAARLNLANIDADSGRESQAIAAYDSLLDERPDDSSARFSRALVQLRLNRPSEALGDLDRLLQDRVEVSRARPGELLSQRAMANLLTRKPEAAVDDAKEAISRYPCPANERLLQRALLAARRYGELDLQRPEEIRAFPLGGKPLTEDLLAASKALKSSAGDPSPARYRSLRNQSLIFSALGEHRQALRCANELVSMSLLAPEGYLIRARLRRQAGDLQGAISDVERGLEIQPEMIGLRELHGILLAETGKREAGIAELDLVISRAPSPEVHAARAMILESAGEPGQAVFDWSLALQRELALPQAFLGRARCYVQLRAWERALADLEQAASWASGDLRLQVSILLTYFQCLAERPAYGERFRQLFNHTLHEARHRLSEWAAAVKQIP